MDPTRIVQRMDSDDDEADLESLRLAALRSRNQKKHSPSQREVLEVPRGGDVRYVSRRSSERSVVHISSQMESWASDQESSSTDYEEIDLNDTNDIEKSDNVVEAHDAEEFDDVSSSGQSGTSAKDDDFQIIERNEVSVEDDFDVNEDGDKNSNFEDIAVVLENNNLGEDDDDIVKTIDVNDNTDECESLEVTEAVESESSESEVGLDADDEDDDSLDNGIDTCMVDNITITIRNDARIRDSNDDDDDDDRGQETLKQTQKELPIDKGLQEENEEEKEVLDVRSVGSADPEQPDGMDEEVQVGGNSKGNGSTDDKVESKNVIEVENERKDVKKMRSRKSVKEEDGSSSDSSSSSSSDSDSSSSDDTTSSSDSQSDDPDARIIKSKVACETKDKKASMGKNNVSTTLKDNTKLKTVENKGSRTSPKGEGQIDHDHISIGGGSSDNDNDFDEDNQPVVKSTVRMRRLYSNSKGKKRSRSSSTEGLSRQQRSRSRTRTDRSRSQGRLWERSNFQDWSHNRWRRSRSRSRERNSYRIRYRYSNREPRRTRSRSRDNLLSRSSRAFDHRKTRSRSRDQSRDRSKGWSKGWSRDRLRDGKDTKTSGGLERSKQRKDEKVSREPEKTREQKDSKLKTSVENKRVRERKQETNGRVENLSPKEHYKLTSCVRKKSVAVPEKRRDELDIHGKTAANRHKKGDDMTVRQAVKGLQKEDLRERLKPRKSSEPASSAVSKSISSKPVQKTIVKFDSETCEPARSAVSESINTKPVRKTTVKLCGPKPSESSSSVSKSISTKPVLQTVVKLCESKRDLIIVKKLKTETKIPESRERDLDARIAKIKQQNEAIMQRRKEVEADKQKYLV